MDVKKIGLVASICAGLVALHGITSKAWKAIHTALVVVGILIAVVSLAE